MKLTIKLLPLIISLFILNACNKEDNGIFEPQNLSINKIMPLGASRVESASPEYESYRYELWKKLKANNWNFDFIGTLSDEASYTDFEFGTFDRDHEGRGGWTSGQILNKLDDWLNELGSCPEIVLLKFTRRQ